MLNRCVDFHVRVALKIAVTNVAKTLGIPVRKQQHHRHTHERLRQKNKGFSARYGRLELYSEETVAAAAVPRLATSSCCSNEQEMRVISSFVSETDFQSLSNFHPKLNELLPIKQTNWCTNTVYGILSTWSCLEIRMQDEITV